MRLLIVVIAIPLALICEKCGAQGEMPSRDGKVFYEKIDSSVTGDASELLARARLWLANVFKDSKEVIQVDDKENNTLMGKGNVLLHKGITPYLVQFSIKVDCKNNKYRVQIYNVTTASATGDYVRSVEWLNEQKGHDKIKLKINEEMYATLDDLKKAMGKNTSNDF